MDDEPTALRTVRVEFDLETFEVLIGANPVVSDAHLVDAARERVLEAHDPHGRFRRGEVLA